MRRYCVLALGVGLFLLLGGCGPVLSKEALRQVNWGVDYSRVRADPQAYRGKTLLLGGRILEADINREGTSLEVLKFTLGQRDYPEKPDEMNGRFLARTDRFLDPDRYRAGRLITLTGTVVGEQSKPLGKSMYRYPVFRIDAIYLWPEPYPPGPYYYYYSPYPPPPFYYDPFWYPYPFWYR